MVHSLISLFTCLLYVWLHWKISSMGTESVSCLLSLQLLKNSVWQEKMLNKYLPNERMKTCQVSFGRAAVILLLPQASYFPSFSPQPGVRPLLWMAPSSVWLHIGPNASWSRSLEGQPHLLQGQAQWPFLGLSFFDLPPDPAARNFPETLRRMWPETKPSPLIFVCLLKYVSFPLPESECSLRFCA